MGIRHVRFLPDGIAFDRYPYPGARVHPRGLVPWSEVLEVDPAASPPEVRIAGETLFVSHELREELARAAEAHAVPVVRRVDVWGMLLDPFLDTWFDDDVQERTLQRLEENGISRAEAASIRERVGFPMLHHNAMLWEWVHLGLWDLLEAHRNVWVRLLRGLTPGRYCAFYAWTMEVAGRGKVIPPIRWEAEAAEKS
jgi:hypothetical protein